MHQRGEAAWAYVIKEPQWASFWWVVGSSVACVNDHALWGGVIVGCIISLY